jgi:hypothetical protein
MNVSNCTHDHGEGLLKRELSHVKAHWLSCMLFCLVTHAVFHVFELLAAL